MKCPKYIKEALDKRLKAAQQFNHYDLIVSEYIDKHDLDVDSCHYHGGCRKYCISRIFLSHNLRSNQRKIDS